MVVFLSIASIHAGSSFYSYSNGKKYEFRITEERLPTIPKWDPVTNANPPCSAASALSTSAKFFKRLSVAHNRKDHKWWFESLALVKIGKRWAWKATYEFWPRNGRRIGMPAERNCWILMDGSVLEPIEMDGKK